VNLKVIRRNRAGRSRDILGCANGIHAEGV